MYNTVLVTGAAGFIGMHTVLQLQLQGYNIIGIDNLNEYYDRNLKIGRLKQCGIYQENPTYNTEYISTTIKYKFIQLDIVDKTNLEQLFNEYQIDVVINLAAQAGVRYSLSNPDVYIQSNIVGFSNILECCRNHQIKHLIYASSSSVYGLNKEIPFSTSQNVDHPVSLYAATKKSNELMAHTYSHLFKLPVTGLRFFTVYGPWYRPDMAMFLFTKAILSGEPIKVFNDGKMKRDFTYIDDVVFAITSLIDKIPEQKNEWKSTTSDPSSSTGPYRIYNVGNSKPANLIEMIEILEEKLGIKAIKNFLPMQPGDMESTYADVSDLQQLISYQPSTTLEKGISQFVDWYLSYYR